MLIKEVEEKTGLTKKAIRHYEENNLFTTQRKENGYKDYSEENVKVLEIIKELRNLDFSIEEIRYYLFPFFSEKSRYEYSVFYVCDSNARIFGSLYKR